jgi:TPP-dependent indolepyruvate ferredoxin oxidoreductase alpha subunit
MKLVERNAVEKGFELSEASNTPVMLEVRVRACHVHGRFPAKDNVRPSFTLRDALENPRRQETYLFSTETGSIMRRCEKGPALASPLSPHADAGVD